jgi:beta-phosphoglucomutase
LATLDLAWREDPATLSERFVWALDTFGALGQEVVVLRAVLFDFDGVIADSEPLHWAAMNQVLALHGVPQVSKDYYYRKMLGLDDRGLFRDSFALAGTPLPPDLLATLVAQKSERFLAMAGCRDVMLPGAEEFIKAVGRRYPLAICSGALRHEIETILRAAGLREHFGVIVAAEDVQRGKPDPEGYLLAKCRLQEKHRLDPPLAGGECLVIEDSCAGIEAAKRAGMTCLAVTTSLDGERLSLADAVVATLHEADAGLLSRLFGEAGR